MEAALRGAREVGHKQMKDISPKRPPSRAPKKTKGRPGSWAGQVFLERNMSFIQREQNRISALLANGAHNKNKSAELAAALHALAWANDPTGFTAPSQFLLDIREGQGDCSDECRPPLSSDICGLPRLER
jgi:hypothetical protein